MSSKVIEVKLQENQKSWVDHAKFGVDLLGPLIAAVFGIWVLRLTKRIEQNQWRNQKLIEKRILIWDQIGPDVNDIYCYCRRIGAWKEMTPINVIASKRRADKVVHLSRPYFTNKFFAAYIGFTASSFAMYQGSGDNAKIRTSLWEHRNERRDWENSWDELFKDNLDEDNLVFAYEEMLRQVQEELSSN